MLAVLFLVCVFFYFCFKEGENSIHAIKNQKKAKKKHIDIYNDDYGHTYLTKNGHAGISYIDRNGEWKIKDCKTCEVFGENSETKKQKELHDKYITNKANGVDATPMKHRADPSPFYFGFPEKGSSYNVYYTVSENGWLAFDKYLYFNPDHIAHGGMMLHFWLRLNSGEVILRNPETDKEHFIENAFLINRENSIQDKPGRVMDAIKLGELIVPIINDYYSNVVNSRKKYEYDYYNPNDKCTNGATAWLKLINNTWSYMEKWMYEIGLHKALEEYYDAIRNTRSAEYKLKEIVNKNNDFLNNKNISSKYSDITKNYLKKEYYQKSKEYNNELKTCKQNEEIALDKIVELLKAHNPKEALTKFAY